MPQHYFNQPNQGIVIGSAFGNSIMQSYNKAMFMQADIQRFKSSERRFAEATAFREEGREISNFKTYADLLRQQTISGLTTDTAGDRQVATEFKSRFIDRIGTDATLDEGQAETSRLSRIGNARLESTKTKDGEPIYIDRKTGEEYNRNPFKPGIKGIGKKRIAGKPSASEAEFFKIRKIMEDIGSDDITKRHARRLIEANTSAPAREYIEELKRNKTGVTPLKERLLANPQDTDQAFLDNTISIEAFNQAVADYAADLMDIGFTAEEAQAEAEAEAERLRVEDAPGRRAFPEKQETIPSPTGASGGVSTINTQAEYDALPSGTQYRDANGNIGTKR